MRFQGCQSRKEQETRFQKAFDWKQAEKKFATKGDLEVKSAVYLLENSVQLLFFFHPSVTDMNFMRITPPGVDTTTSRRCRMGATEVSNATQYLTFKLGEEIFAVDVAQVREILDFTTITKVPQTPEFMRGVINLRGSVVPVVDMRLKFGMSKTDKSVNTCIVVVEVVMENETLVIGALADSVQEVIELEPSQIEPPPKIGSRLKVEFLKGMGKRDEHFIMILAIDKLFSASEISIVQEAQQIGQQQNPAKKP